MQMPAQRKPTQASQPDDVDARLQERLDELESLKGFENETTFSGDQRESYGELSGYDQHPADTATETFQREMDESIRDLVDREEAQVRDAMDRNAAGTYGICESCGRQIDPERLHARAEATLCIDCQRTLEQQTTAR
jgi:RNA polymerase-binding transcription factor DksA